EPVSRRPEKSAGVLMPAKQNERTNIGKRDLRPLSDVRDCIDGAAEVVRGFRGVDVELSDAELAEHVDLLYRRGWLRERATQVCNSRLRSAVRKRPLCRQPQRRGHERVVIRNCLQE